MRDPEYRDRMEALFTFLVDEEGADITLDDLRPTSENYNQFDTPEGEYLVLTDSEADQACYDDTENLIDEMGLDLWRKDTWQYDYVIDNFVEGSDALWDDIKAFYISYFEDIASEHGTTFKTRQQDEIIEILDRLGELPVDYDTLVDFVNDENSDPDCAAFMEEWDDNVDDYIDICAEDSKNDWDNPLEYYTFNFGQEEIKYLADHGLLDFDIQGITDWIIDNDGRGQILSRYDGEEHEVDVNGVTYYIYRV